MADFIVDEEEIYKKGAPVRQRKLKEKKLRQAVGVSSSKLEEGDYLFGDVDELLKLRKQSLAMSGKSDDNGDFEPFVLGEKYMAGKDDCIHEIDMPERMQISEEITGPAPVDKMSFEEESTWILSQLATNMIPLFCEKRVTEGTDEGLDLLKKINKEDVVRFLKLHHVEKYEIPFIAMYRKEQCLSLLKDLEQDEAENKDTDVSERTPRLKWHKVLWAIKELDRKWLLLQKRKSALQQFYNKRYEEESCNIHDEASLTLNQQLFESITKSLKKAESERDIDDVDLKFSLHFPPAEIGVEEGLFRRPKRKSQYDNCIKAGLWKVAGKFGYNSEQFGLHITLDKMRMEVLEDPEESPEEIASNFTCTMFETPEAVLKGARHMAAVEISCEPCFRKHVRSIFLDKALVSTSPTPEGNKAIDSFHKFAGVKWLRDKPLFRFLDAQWLLIQKAEEEKLLQVTIRLPESTLNLLTRESNDCYFGDGLSKYGRLWNEQRKLILQDALSNLLLPSMEKEARALLTTRGKNWLLMEYGKQLWNRVSVAPYQRKESCVGLDEETAPRVMACCWGPGKPATTFVMLDSSGEVLDVLCAGSLSLRSQNVIDQQRILKFMRDHQPHVVVLGAVNLSCTRLKDDICEIIFKMVEENPRDVGQAMDGLGIVYGDESLPHLYEDSQISSDQLPGKLGIVKRAVALGRYLQNPLAMVATLCGSGREIVNWKLSSLDNFLAPDEKYEMVEQVMVDVTNQVGVDMNLALSHDWIFAPLQFVSGLGPQKAVSLKWASVGAKAVENRKELTGRGLRTKKVFHNAVGFLRVDCSGLLATGRDIDLLDDTRIHPESYHLAKELAEAVHKYYAQDDTNNDVMQALAIEYVRDNRELLKGFDIDEYADDYKKEKGENKKETLYDIKVELLHGFQDPRRPYEEPTQDEEFYMISVGNEDTLAEGRIVQATVRRVLPQRAICVLDSGLTGILSKDEFTDEGDDFNLKDKLHEGDMLSCKIREIQKNRYQVFLTSKESELMSNQNQNFHDVDPYYFDGQSSLLSLQEKSRKEELEKKHFKPRMIVHPRFQNMTANEAMEFLSDKDAGESIFRPSSRGASYLTLTLKVYDGVYAHKDIIEGGKDHKDITSLLRLGKTLKVGDDNFGDLDEVMERYVDPLVTHLKAMLSYQKFKRGSKAEVDDILRAEKSDYPMRIVYCLSISYEHPGTFILSYIRSTNPHHEYVGLYPKGFKFRKHTFKNIDQLVAYFHKHIDLQHESALSTRSVVAMESIRGPATGVSSLGASMGSGWGNNDGGWKGQSNLDKDKSSTPGSRGINDCIDGGGGNGHPSGLPSPYGGRGRGRGRGSYNDRGANSSNDRKDSGYGTTKWGSHSKDGGEGDDGCDNFPGPEVQNSPAKEAFPGGWGSNGTGSFGGGNWGSGSNTGGWGGSNGAGSASGGNWGGAQGGGSASGGNQGGRGGRGCGRGSCDSRGNNNGNERKDSNYGASRWGSDSKDEGGGNNGWSNFLGAEIQNVPAREEDFPSRWGSSGSGTEGGNWGGGSSTGGWGSSSGGGSASGDNQGGCGGRGRGRGCGRGRGSGDGRGNNIGNERNDSNYGTSRWGSDSKDGGGGNNGWSNFPGAKVQNIPTTEAFPGRWGRCGSDSAGGNWGGGGSSTGGWGGSSGRGSASGGNWGSGRGGGCASGGNRGGRGERGRGRGCGRGPGRGSYDSGGNDSGNQRKDSSGEWGSSGSGSAGGGNWGVGGGNTGGWGGSASGGHWGGGRSGGSGWTSGGGNDGKGSGGWGYVNSSAGGGGGNVGWDSARSKSVGASGNTGGW